MSSTPKVEASALVAWCLKCGKLLFAGHELRHAKPCPECGAHALIDVAEYIYSLEEIRFTDMTGVDVEVN